MLRLSGKYIIIFYNFIASMRSVWAISWLRQLVTGPSLWRPVFAPGSINVRFVVDKVALGQVFLQVLQFSPVNISFYHHSPKSYHLGDEQYVR
jgi:hypothetical protein